MSRLGTHFLSTFFRKSANKMYLSEFTENIFTKYKIYVILRPATIVIECYQKNEGKWILCRK